MPPPLFLRHTRPCRPPWSAHLVRRASTTSHINHSTAGDDSFVEPGDGTNWQSTGNHKDGLQQNASEQSADEFAQPGHTRRNLWSAAMHGISPFVSKDTRPSVLPEESRQSPPTTAPPANSENVASTDTSKPQIEGAAAGSGEAETSPSFRVRTFLSKLPEHNPAVHRKLHGRAALSIQTKPAQTSHLLRRVASKRDPNPIHVVQTSQLSKHDAPAQERRLFRQVGAWQDEPKVYNAHTVQHGARDMKFVEHDQMEQKSDHGPQLKTLQQQLKELAEDVKLLKSTFDALANKFESSGANQVEAAASHSNQNAHRASPSVAETAQPSALSSPTPRRPAVEVTRRGQKVYCRSSVALAKIAKSLEADPSFTAVEISERIRARLAFIARRATREDDRFMRSALLSTGMFEKHPSRSGKRHPIKLVAPIRQVDLVTHRDGRKHLPNPVVPVKSQQLSAATGSSVAHEAVGEASVVQGVQARKASGDVSDHIQANVDRAKDGGAEMKLSDAASSLSPSPASVDGIEKRSSENKSQSHQTSAVSAPDGTEQSLLEELFPEANTPVSNEPAEDREQVPKLDPPSSDRLIRPETVGPPKSSKQQTVESFLKSSESVTVLQLQHCSTELIEPDFRRLIPKGKHIGAWNRDGAYYKVIPGRNPISLERLPFYYILFKSAESAYAYQNNVTRLHKLAALHQPTNIFSAVPAPKGFLEDGEDIDAVTSSYLLRPTEQAPAIRTLMQPYHPGLRSLFTQGGYSPIVPDVDDKRNRIYRVLMHIEGYEPSLSDLFTVFRRDAAIRGVPMPLRNESITSLHRLRDLVNLKTHVLPIATTNPRAYDVAQSGVAAALDSAETKIEYEDPNIAYFMKHDDPVDRNNAKEINQIIMNQVYNRWILEFEDEDEARRFAIAWHRRALPDLSKTERTWKDYEEARMCNTELLW